MHLAGHASGQVAITDIHDSFVPNALEGIKIGYFVRCRVLGLADAKGANNSIREKRGAALPDACKMTSLTSSSRKMTCCT